MVLGFRGLAIGVFAAVTYFAAPLAIAAAQTQFVIYSINAEARIELSCNSAKAIDLFASGHHKPPVIQAPDHTAGAGNRGAIQYTVDGQGPFLEEWLPRDQGIVPRNRDQLRLFVSRMVDGHIMFLRMRGMSPFEFQLESYAEGLRGFALACSAKP